MLNVKLTLPLDFPFALCMCIPSIGENAQNLSKIANRQAGKYSIVRQHVGLLAVNLYFFFLDGFDYVKCVGC